MKVASWEQEKKKKERMEDAGSDAGVSVYVCRMPVLEMSEKECT